MPRVNAGTTSTDVIKDPTAVVERMSRQNSVLIQPHVTFFFFFFLNQQVGWLTALPQPAVSGENGLNFHGHVITGTDPTLRLITIVMNGIFLSQV